MNQPTKHKTAIEAVKVIKSGDRIFVHGSAATPHTLLQALGERSSELEKVEVTCISTLGEMPLADPERRDAFFFNALFVSQNIRQAINNGGGNYIPVFLSEIPGLFHKQILPIDVALINISPPDKHGFCSLGVS